LPVLSVVRISENEVQLMKRGLLLVSISLLALLVSACGLSEADVQSTVTAAQGYAISTVHAQYTEIALLTPSATNTLPPTSTPAVTATLAATATTAAGGGGTTSGCDAMTFVADVTVADGEEVTAGTAFTKTWQVSNSGTCDWSTAYQVLYSSGDQMGGPSSTPLAAAVTVGATGNVSVSLVAPSTAGSYTGYWALANAAGQAFGYLSVVITVP
jgi:hypothetical protein